MARQLAVRHTGFPAQGWHLRSSQFCIHPYQVSSPLTFVRRNFQQIPRSNFSCRRRSTLPPLHCSNFHSTHHSHRLLPCGCYCQNHRGNLPGRQSFHAPNCPEVLRNYRRSWIFLRLRGSAEMLKLRHCCSNSQNRGLEQAGPHPMPSVRIDASCPASLQTYQARSNGMTSFRVTGLSFWCKTMYIV